MDSINLKEAYVAIILVNYNGWKNTIECLESLLKLSYSNYKIIIVDNRSVDDSVNNIILWSEGQLTIDTYNNPTIENLVYPLVKKPIKVNIIESDQLEILDPESASITIIRSEVNLGFAGGNNIGIKRALYLNAPYIWLLNNDTVVDRNSLSELINTAETVSSSKPTGIIGSKLFYYDKPAYLQAIAGKYNPVIATSKHIGSNECDRGQFDNIELDSNYYIVGASMFITNNFIKEVGLMNEEYFLYYEEIDWRNRALQHGFDIKICPKSIVYHKEGASISPDRKSNTKSYLSDFYSIKNRFIITKKYYPKYLFFVYLTLVPVIINRLKRKQFDRIKLIYQIFKDSFRININEN